MGTSIGRARVLAVGDDPLTARALGETAGHFPSRTTIGRIC
jgi:hypothetical protein